MEYVWKKKLQLGKGLYLLARYTTLLGVVIDVLLQFSNTSVQVRFFFKAKLLEWHYLNIVSTNTILRVQFLRHVRSCNLLVKLAEALFIPTVIGVQGINVLSCQCQPVDNLYLCRPFVCPSLCYFWSQKNRFSRSWVTWGLHHYPKPGSFSCQCRVRAWVMDSFTSHQ